MTRRLRRAIIAVGLGVGLVVVALVLRRASDGESRRDRFVDAYASGLAASDLSGDDARCVAEATVDAIGPAELAAATSLDGIRANPPVAPSQLGIEVSEAQGRAYYEALKGCMGLRRAFTASMGDAGAACFDQLVDDGLLGELVVARFTTSTSVSADLEAALTTVAERCPVEPAGGDTGPEIQAVASPPGAVQQGGHTVTVITYNVRGLLRGIPDQRSVWVDSDMTRFTERAGAEVARRQADFVLLQEICGYQAELIAERSSLGGHAMSVIAVTPHPPGASRYEEARTLCPGDTPARGANVPYGRAILAHLPNATPIAPPAGEDALCIRAESPLAMRVCNVHTENPRAGSIPQAFAQWSRDSDEPLILGGDFNTTPGAWPITGLFGSMNEAERSCNGGPAAHCTPTDPDGPAPFYTKIDYIFGDKSNFEPLHSEVVSLQCAGVGACSDHQMEVGTFSLSDEAFELPPQIDPSTHGDSVWALYLAVTGSYDDPKIARAEEAARGMGYTAGGSDLACDAGAAAALGRDPASFAAAVPVYFASEEAAALARAAFERRDIPVVGVANVTLVCLD